MKIANAKLIRIIALVVAVIALFYKYPEAKKAGEQRTHNYEDIVITLNDCRSKETDTDYVVMLDYEIKNKTGAGLISVSIETSIKDEDGLELGTISSTFEDDEVLVQKGKSCQQTAFLDTRGARNAEELFAELYKNGLKNATVTIRILNVRWDDGFSYYDYG